MATTWTFIALIQVYSGRYLKHWWRWRYLTHAVCGGISGVLTLTAYLMILKARGWEIELSYWHGFFGNISFVLVESMILGGATLFVVMKTVNLDWKTKYLLLLKTVHGTFGYFLVIAIQVTVMSGILKKAANGLSQT